MTIQCRALSDPIDGAAISSTAPPIHATVPACQTSRIRVRRLSGWIVALAKTFVSPSTPWIIAGVEAASKDETPLEVLLRRVFSERLAIENAVRTWASVDPAARAAVQAIDRRRLGYVEGLLTQSGLTADVARARAQILYWAF